MMTDKKKSDDGLKRNLFFVSSLGINLVASSVVGIVIGIYLDKWFHTRPILTIALFLLGTVAGFRQIYKEIRKLGNEDKEHEQK